MLTIYAIITILLLWGSTVQKKNCYYDGYISMEQCNCIKGFFIVVVFCRHIAPYLMEAGYDFSIGGDGLFRWVNARMGQLLVVMFLFYSGYGVTESIKRKGREYVDKIPRKRVLVTLANFDVAVLLFLIVDVSLGIEYSARDILLSFTGWQSIGNSNWYIFVILCCYMSSYLAYRVLPKEKVSRRLFGGGNLGFITCVYVALLLKKPGYWYNTIFAYPLGVYYSLYKIEAEKVLRRYYPVALAVSFIVFVVLMNMHFGMKGLYANLEGCTMSILIVVLSMKIELHSKPLAWLGQNLFPLYIYQRIGMIVLGRIDEGYMIANYPYVYIVGCVLMTLFFGWTYKFVKFK